jgi:hypothetical protein
MCMNIRTERRPGALVTYRVRRFDHRRGFAAGNPHTALCFGQPVFRKERIPFLLTAGFTVSALK